MTQEKTNRNYKDSVFVDLFAHDVTAKENFISLYNALHGTNLDAKTTDVQPVMQEQTKSPLYINKFFSFLLHVWQKKLKFFRFSL